MALASWRRVGGLMGRRLVAALRNVAQDAETVAAAARKVLRELDAAHEL